MSVSEKAGQPRSHPDDILNGSNELKGYAGARTPFVGETVLVDLGNQRCNDCSLFPAIVVRVWGDGASGSVPSISARILQDSDGLPFRRSSLAHKSLMSPPTSFNQPRPSYFIFLGEDPIP